MKTMASSSIRTIDPGSEDYENIVNLVTESYASIHKADVTPTPDEFVFMQVAESEQENYAGAYGITYPKFNCLFSEQYLDRPVEQIAYEITGDFVDRQHICEIGSFSSFGYKSAAYKLLETLPHILWSKGMRFTLVTLTPIVEKMINKLGYTYHPVGVADITKLSAGQREKWGSYYEHKPVVFLVDILESAKSTLPLQFGRFTIDVIKVNQQISNKLLNVA
ncbi:thermostable hemolysin [Thalassomonas actiniarum]|uniref:Thermostable hemolysin n=1 Tax=Thalassomonas actiniarum TaxID=485447 RepID=A0AAE9YQG7_9GAMM|nr:thermostable hemolysin [Thalassomonas actiniarum]WDD98802.1 thermostable hemolysin [Thalassomonas actiniarum]